MNEYITIKLIVAGALLALALFGWFFFKILLPFAKAVNAFLKDVEKRERYQQDMNNERGEGHI